MSGEIESKDQDTDKGQVAARWLREIELAGAHEKKWRDRADKVLKRYRDEEAEAEERKAKFNILYANTEVLRGVIYQKTPVADVRRRFLDKDPVGREAAQALQRALSFCVDAYDFDSVMHQVVEDYLLPGRGIGRVKYVPSFGPMMDANGQPVMGDDGKPMQQVVYETVETDYVEWDMVRISPAKRWSKVRWMAFGELLTRDELKKQFGDKVGSLVALDWAPKDKEKEDEMFKRALVWTVWDKTSRKVHVVAKGYPQGRLSVVDDPLNLEGFFPCPRPIYAVHTTNTMVPIPEYAQYQDQAMELDTLTARIEVLTDALRRRGIYDGSFPEIEKLATAGDNVFIPVEKFSNLMEKGGVEKLLYEAPVEQLAKVLMHLMEQRESVKQTIYEITGLADIVRGVSAASETLGAQQLKARYANSRTGPRQKEVERFARDLFRLKAEIISEKFSPQTLAIMTGLDLPMDEAGKQALLAQAQAQGQEAVAQLQAKPTWEQVMQILRDDKLRGFRVDIETDSTVVPDAIEEQKNRVELLTAVTQFITGVAPAVQTGAVPMQVAKEMLSFGVRGFKVSPQLEQALDQIGNDNGQQQQGAQKQVMEQRQAMEMRTAQANLAKAEAEAREANAKAQEQEHKARNAGLTADNQEMTNKGIQVSQENDSLLPQIAEQSMQLQQALAAVMQELQAMRVAQQTPRSIRIERGPDGRAMGINGRPLIRDQQGQVVGLN